MPGNLLNPAFCRTIGRCGGGVVAPGLRSDVSKGGSDMQAPLTDLLRGGIPVLVVLGAAIAVIRMCPPTPRAPAPVFRCPSSPYGSVALFRSWRRRGAAPGSYLRFLCCSRSPTGPSRSWRWWSSTCFPAGAAPAGSGDSPRRGRRGGGWPHPRGAPPRELRRRRRGARRDLGGPLDRSRPRAAGDSREPLRRACAHARASVQAGRLDPDGRPDRAGAGGELARGAPEAHPAGRLPGRAEQRGGQVRDREHEPAAAGPRPRDRDQRAVRGAARPCAHGAGRGGARRRPGCSASRRRRARVARFDDSAIVYQLVYYLDDYPRIHDLQGEVLSRCWYAFRRHGIDMPFPTADVFWRDAVKVAGEARTSRWPGRRPAGRGRVPGGAHVGAAREPGGRSLGACRTRLGGAVVRQGDAGDSLFLVVAGRVEVSVRAPGGGAEQSLATLGTRRLLRRDVAAHGRAEVGDDPSGGGDPSRDPSQGGPRPLLVADPTVPERLSKTLARRQAERDEALHRAPTTQYEGPGVDRAGQLLGLIRRFFGLMSGDPLARG